MDVIDVYCETLAPFDPGRLLSLRLLYDAAEYRNRGGR